MATIDRLRLPTTTATQENGVITVTVEIIGIEPSRSLTTEEVLDGFISLDPIQIQATSINQAKDRAIRCSASAIDATEDFEMDPTVYAWTAYSVGQSVSTALQAIGLGRMNGRDALVKLIQWVTRDYHFYGVYAATVAATSTGQTADLECDDPRIKGVGLQGVPISYGVPDCVATINKGCRVLLMFENGDKTKPRASVFDGSAIDIKFGGAQALPVARIGDTVTITATGLTAPTGAVTGVAQGTIVGGATKTKAQ